MYIVFELNQGSNLLSFKVNLYKSIHAAATIKVLLSVLKVEENGVQIIEVLLDVFRACPNELFVIEAGGSKFFMRRGF